MHLAHDIFPSFNGVIQSDPAALLVFIEAGVVPFEVLDVASHFFDHGDKVIVVSGKLGVIRHQLL